MEPADGYTERSDGDLVASLRSGDTDALAELSERHSGATYGLALRILADPGWAEEIAQDVLLRLWRKPELYDPARGELRRWLLSVTHHAAIDGLRGRRGTARASSAGPDALDGLRIDDPEPSERVWQRMQAQTVREALRQLPPAQREALELAYYKGYSQSEIAQSTGQPLGTVKTRLRLGLRKLRESLNQVGVTES
ncbi:MAG: sigma-70 family RNA polymerase sigma factor [Chloroflexota bacterium]|nr:sigma-70 family RNA polymerase sigma factor [Chloroflexota bacterium]